MRRIAFIIALTVSSLTFAQQQGGGGTGGGGTGGGGTGGGGTGGGGTGGSSTSGGLSSGGSLGLGSGSTTGGTNTRGGTGAGAGASGTGRGGAGGSTSFSVSTTNFLQPTYANPLYPSRPNSQNLSVTAGTGFGQPSFGAVTATTQTGAGARGTGGATGATAFTATSNNISRVMHIAELKFPVKKIEAGELQADLQSIIGRSSSIKSPESIQVVIDQGVVVLRGKVTSDDERRLVEGMMRLTPGVRQIRNELQTP